MPKAGVAMIRSKPSRSGSASLAVQKGKRGEHPEDDKGGEQTRGSHSLNSATYHFYTVKEPSKRFLAVLPRRKRAALVAELSQACLNGGAQTTPPLCLLQNSRTLHSAPLLVNMVLLVMLDEVQMMGILK